MINPYVWLQTMCKSHLICLSKPLDMILAFCSKLVWFWPKFSNSDPPKSKFQIFMINPHLWSQTIWKSHLICLSRPFDMVLAFLGLNWSNFWPKLTKSDPIKSKFQICMINLYSKPQTMWKSHLICLSRPLDMILAFLALNWSNLGPNWAILIF